MNSFVSSRPCVPKIRSGVLCLDAYGMEIGFLSRSQQLDRPSIEIVRDRLRQFLWQKAAGDGVSC
ncbi:MAG: hypothetical protein VX035_11630 [Planctomycetota bacterium]|nr:hypothetical protein [Planctomycetota bacterium]